jgi:two-component system OmpR family sensor kinase
VRSLYAKLAWSLIALFLLTGAIYVIASEALMEEYLQRVAQSVNRDLARNLVSDQRLVRDGHLNEAALADTFKMYMVINPSIELYLLNLDGTIRSYSAEPGKVKRRRVSLEPIQAFLRGDRIFPLLGDDPRSHDRKKPFSVTPVPSAADPEGYLYVVLRGEDYARVADALQQRLLLGLAGWSVAGSLALGLGLGLFGLRMIMRRLGRLSAAISAFRSTDFRDHRPFLAPGQVPADEIDRLGAAYDAMAARIRDQFDELQRQDRVRRDLIAQASHDLRTPLASMRGYIDTLRMKGDRLTATERDDYLGIAQRQAVRLTRLVDELFELAKLEARETLPRREPFAPAELVQDVVQKHQLQAQQAKIDLRADLRDGLPRIDGDIALIERALENLIANALDHTAAGGRVDVAVDRDGPAVLLQVRDTGCGIDPEALPHIFDRLYSGRRDGGHGGLGLTITRRIVELSGGSISVESRVGEGTRVAVRLPALTV